MQNRQEELNNLIQTQQWTTLAYILVNSARDYKAEISNVALMLPREGEAALAFDAAIRDAAHARAQMEYAVDLGHLGVDQKKIMKELDDIDVNLRRKIEEARNRGHEISSKALEESRSKMGEALAGVGLEVEKDTEVSSLRQTVEKINSDIAKLSLREDHKQLDLSILKDMYSAWDKKMKEAKKAYEYHVKELTKLEEIRSKRALSTKESSALRRLEGKVINERASLSNATVEVKTLKDAVDAKNKLPTYEKQLKEATDKLQKMRTEKIARMQTGLVVKQNQDEMALAQSVEKTYTAQKAQFEKEADEAKKKQKEALSAKSKVIQYAHTEEASSLAVGSKTEKIRQSVIASMTNISTSISYLLATKKPEYVLQAAAATAVGKAGQAHRAHFIHEVAVNTMVLEALQIPVEKGGLNDDERYKLALEFVGLYRENSFEREDIVLKLLEDIEAPDKKDAFLKEITKYHTISSEVSLYSTLNIVGSAEKDAKVKYAERLLLRDDVSPVALVVAVKKLGLSNQEIAGLGSIALGQLSPRLEHAKALYNIAGESERFIKAVSESTTTSKELFFLYNETGRDAKIGGQTILNSLKMDERFLDNLKLEDFINDPEQRFELAQMLREAYKSTESEKTKELLDKFYKDVIYIRGDNVLPSILNKYSENNLHAALTTAVLEHGKNHTMTKEETDKLTLNALELVLHAPNLESFDKTGKALDRLFDKDSKMSMLDKVKMFFAPILSLLDVVPSSKELAHIAAFISGQKRTLDAGLSPGDKGVVEGVKEVVGGGVDKGPSRK